RGVESVDGLDGALRGSSRHQHGLEDQLMVPVDIAAELSVDDLRLYLSHNLLEAADDIGERVGVQSLVGERQRAHVLDAEDVGGLVDVGTLPDTSRTVAKGLALADDHRGHSSAGASVPRHRTTAPQQLVV